MAVRQSSNDVYDFHSKRVMLIISRLSNKCCSMLVVVYNASPLSYIHDYRTKCCIAVVTLRALYSTGTDTTAILRTLLKNAIYIILHYIHHHVHCRRIMVHVSVTIQRRGGVLIVAKLIIYGSICLLVTLGKL
jgi:hypothetical protein